MEIADVNLPRSFKGPAFLEALGREEQGDGDQQDAHRNGRTERPIVRGAEKALHNVGDHGGGGTADEERSEEIAEGEDEGERCSSEQSGNGKRKNDAEECGAAVGAEIVRGFDERAGNVFEGGIDGKENEGGVYGRE